MPRVLLLGCTVVQVSLLGRTSVTVDTPGSLRIGSQHATAIDVGQAGTAVLNVRSVDLNLFSTDVESTSTTLSFDVTSATAVTTGSLTVDVGTSCVALSVLDFF